MDFCIFVLFACWWSERGDGMTGKSAGGLLDKESGENEGEAGKGGRGGGDDGGGDD